MVRRLILVIAGLFVLSTLSAIAGENQDVKAKSDFRFDVRESDRTDAVLKNLSHEIDLWHDAALKRNGKRMRQHEKRIFSLIQDDLKARDRVIYRYENELGSSAKSAVKEGEQVRGNSKVNDDTKDLRKARQLVKAKEMLFDSIKRTDTFSNRYRLLGDYIEIVKRENKMNRIELAEDASDIRNN